MNITTDRARELVAEMRSRAETADMVLGRVGQYELKAWADRLEQLTGGGEAVIAQRDMWYDCLIEVTATLDEHPEINGELYDGPCACKTCQSYAD